MKASICFFFGVALLLPANAALAGAPDEIRVVVISDLADPREIFVRPTPDKPLYYVPTTAGYAHSGSVLPGETTPPPTPQVQYLIAKALAAQGYRYLTPKSPPSIVLMLAWGYKAPIIDADSMEFTNEADMESLVLGINQNMSGQLSMHQTALVDATKHNRYYLMVTAYDFAATKQKKVVPLWCTRASTERDGHTLGEVLPALIAAAAPTFGTQMGVPAFIYVSAAPMPHAGVPGPMKAP